MSFLFRVCVFKRFFNAPQGVGGRVGAHNSGIWKLSCILVHRSKLVIYPGVLLSRVRPASVFLMPLATYV